MRINFVVYTYLLHTFCRSFHYVSSASDKEEWKRQTGEISEFLAEIADQQQQQLNSTSRFDIEWLKEVLLIGSGCRNAAAATPIACCFANAKDFFNVRNLLRQIRDSKLSSNQMLKVMFNNEHPYRSHAHAFISMLPSDCKLVEAVLRRLKNGETIVRMFRRSSQKRFALMIALKNIWSAHCERLQKLSSECYNDELRKEHKIPMEGDIVADILFPVLVYLPKFQKDRVLKRLRTLLLALSLPNVAIESASADMNGEFDEFHPSRQKHNQKGKKNAADELSSSTHNQFEMIAGVEDAMLNAFRKRLNEAAHVGALEQQVFDEMIKPVLRDAELQNLSEAIKARAWECSSTCAFSYAAMAIAKCEHLSPSNLLKQFNGRAKFNRERKEMGAHLLCDLDALIRRYDTNIETKH